jgi:hypothetical protein
MLIDPDHPASPPAAGGLREALAVVLNEQMNRKIACREKAPGRNEAMAEYDLHFN